MNHGGARWVAETEDIGPRGYRILSLRPLPVDGVARLLIGNSTLAPRELSIVGRVAWANGSGDRHHVGLVAIVDPTGADPEKWFRKLVSAQPGMDELIWRVPDRLAANSRLFLRPPPQDISDLSGDEVGVLRLLGDGTSVSEVLQKGSLAEAAAVRAIFALLERRVLTLSLGEAAPAWRWKAAIAGLEARRSGAASQRRVPPILVPSASPRVPAPVVVALPAPPHPAPPLRLVASSTPAPPKAEGPKRPPKAQQCFDLAASAVADGKIADAIPLLRCALTLSPNDREIAALLGQLAFLGRAAPAR